MIDTLWPRRPYQARLLLIPLDPGARGWISASDPQAFEGITVAKESLLADGRTPDHKPTYSPDGEAPATSEGRAYSSSLDQAVHDADVVVLLTHNLGAVDGAAVVAVADSARPSGTLVGAVVVSPGASWEQPAEARAITAVRETVDNIVILKDDRFVVGFLQVLRGGVQDGDTHDAAEPETLLR